MNSIKQRFSDFVDVYIWKYKTSQEKSEQTQFMSKCQIYFEQIYYVLSWQSNMFTMVVLLFLNFLFWIIVQLEIKLFGLFFLMTLVLFVLDSMFINTEKLCTSDKSSEFFDNASIVLWDTVRHLKSFRAENPSGFCLVMSVVFLFLHFLARNTSGYLFFYIIILLIFFIPLGFKSLPQGVANQCKNNLQSFFNIRGILAEDELIPFISDKDFANRDNDLDSLLTDHTADSVSTSLIGGLSSMPSYLDGDDLQNDVEEEDLLPNKSAVRTTSYDLSSESDSEHREINFTSSHFTVDSSSEDEFNLVKDTEVDNGNILQNIIKFALHKNDEQIERQDSSSSSSEFEFLNKEDLKN